MHFAVHPEPFVTVRQIFSDRLTAFITKQESMAIFPDLELPARAGPLAGFGRFCFTFREKLAGTKWPTDLLHVASEP